MKHLVILLSLSTIITLFAGSCGTKSSGFPEPAVSSISGILGNEILSGYEGRLTNFITDSTSEAVRIFHRDYRETGGSWRGEHAGKWLYAAALAYERTGSDTLLESITSVADYLIGQQRENGYLGTYTDTMRFYASPRIPNQTWDVWINGYILKGMMETARVTGEKKYLDASRRLADLMIRTFVTEGKDICNSGPWSGTASTGIIGEFADLFALTGEEKYLDFAVFTIEELNRRPGTEIIDRLLKKYELALVGEGKMYETLRCINGIVKVYLHNGNPDYLAAATHAWNDVAANHLNPAGAPSGGAGIHQECFNVSFMFSPYAYSETCALMEWLVLNGLLLQATGNGKYAAQLEKSAYNAVAGAHFPDGGWQYHSMMNGARSRTGQWACCSSSGTIILEEKARMVYYRNNDNLMVNIYTPSSLELNRDGSIFRLTQKTDYPFGGKVQFDIETDKPRQMSLHLRRPEWSAATGIEVNGRPVNASEKNGYIEIARKWANGDNLTIDFAIEPRINTAVREYNEKGWYIDGRLEYTSFYVGPLLYGTAHADNMANNNPLILNDDPLSMLSAVNREDGTPYRRYSIAASDSNYILVPYFDINSRVNGSVHTVWFLQQNNSLP